MSGTDRLTGQAPACELRRPFDSRCDGPAEVQIADRTGARAWGCQLHAATALRTIVDARIVAGTRDGAMIAVYRLAFPERRS
jgi:hypothetical protein